MLTISGISLVSLFYKGIPFAHFCAGSRIDLEDWWHWIDGPRVLA